MPLNKYSSNTEDITIEFQFLLISTVIFICVGSTYMTSHYKKILRDEHDSANIPKFSRDDYDAKLKLMID